MQPAPLLPPETANDDRTLSVVLESAWLQRLVSPSLRGDPERASRAASLAAISLLFVVATPMIVGLYLVKGDVVTALFEAGLGLSLSIPTLLVRFVGSLRLAAHAMAAILWIALTAISLYFGGWTVSVLFWMGLVPVVVQQMLGLRDALLWFAATVLTVAALFPAGHLYVIEAQARQLPGSQLVGVVLFVAIAFVLALLHEHNLRKVNDELRRAKEVAESADEAKTALLAHISHELRTPMHGLVGASQLLVGATDVLERAELEALVKTSGDALVAIVRDTLDLTRIEAGAFRVRLRAFSPRPLAEGAAALLASRAQRRGLELRCDLSPEVPRFVLGDEARLRQIVLNLLDNAVASTAQGSVKMRLDWADDQLRIEVADTGVGMSPDELERIFEPFARVGERAEHSDGGVGLGLAICRRLAEAMGGDLAVESEVGRGSRFTLSLRAPRTSSPVEPEDDERPTPGLHILVVEDDNVSRIVAGRMLERLGHSCRTAASGKEALQAIDDEDWDVVLMDCRLPDMSGLDVTRRIRARTDARGGIPVVAVTADALAGDEQRCLAAGMDAYLAKPLDVPRLCAVLARVVPVLADATGASGVLPRADRFQSGNAAGAAGTMAGSLPGDGRP